MRFILDENLNDKQELSQGMYNLGSGKLLLSGMGNECFSTKSEVSVEIAGVNHRAFKAGNRHADVNDFNKLGRAPLPGEGTFALFTAELKGMFTVYYSSSSYIRINRFLTADSEKNAEFEIIANSPTGVDRFSINVEPGYTYLVSTTGATNNCLYAGFEFIPDENVVVKIGITNVDAHLEPDFNLSIQDTQLLDVVEKINPSIQHLELLKGHTYTFISEDGGVKILVNNQENITITDNVVDSGLCITYHNVPDALIKGNIIGTPLGTVGKLIFENMVTNRKYTANLNEDNTYSISLKPGEYQAIIETDNDGVTYNRVSAISGLEIFKEIYVEMPDCQKKNIVDFKKIINVPGDYDTLNKAFCAIGQMTNRPAGEAGRVIVNLCEDICEQTVLNEAYVTLKGNGHTISWYYGVGTLYYSIDKESGLYSERLAKDRYSSEEGNGHLWGGVFIARGDHFIVQDTTFINTYNYRITEAERKDIAGTRLSVDRLTPQADVTARAYKERSNAFYIDADMITIKNCKILSSQDTFGRNGPEKFGYRVYVKDSVIGGNVDYICGEFSAVFENCELQWKTHGNDEISNQKIGYIVAPKTSPYVFINCKVTTDGEEKSEVKGLWGRTWGEYSNATFINCETNGYIAKAGWSEMSAGHLSSAIFSEYGNTQMGEPFISDIGKDSGNPTVYENGAYVQSVFRGWNPHIVM